MLEGMTNDTCVKSSMAPQPYKVFSTHANEISGCKIISILKHSHTPNIGGMNVDVRSDLATLTFKNDKHLEYLNSRIIIVQ